MRPKTQEARDGKGLKSIGRPKSGAKTKPLPYSQPRPPSQPNHLPQPPGYGRELGKTTKPISSRNVHLQLEADEHPKCPSPSLLSGPARGPKSHQWWSQNTAPGPCTVMDQKAHISAYAILPQSLLFSDIHSKMTGVTKAVKPL